VTSHKSPLKRARREEKLRLDPPGQRPGAIPPPGAKARKRACRLVAYGCWIRVITYCRSRYYSLIGFVSQFSFRPVPAGELGSFRRNTSGTGDPGPGIRLGNRIPIPIPRPPVPGLGSFRRNTILGTRDRGTGNRIPGPRSRVPGPPASPVDDGLRNGPKSVRRRWEFSRNMWRPRIQQIPFHNEQLQLSPPTMF
jgi:hypothetical protein